MENKYYVISNFIFLAYLQTHCQMKTLHIRQLKAQQIWCKFIDAICTNYINMRITKLEINLQYKILRYCTKIQYHQGKEAWQKDRWPEVSPLSSFAAKILNIYPLSQSVTKLCRTMKHFDLQNICHYCLTCFILPFHSNLYQNEFNIIYCKVQFVSPTINNCTFPATQIITWQKKKVSQHV